MIDDRFLTPLCRRLHLHLPSCIRTRAFRQSEFYSEIKRYSQMDQSISTRFLRLLFLPVTGLTPNPAGFDNT